MSPAWRAHWIWDWDDPRLDNRHVVALRRTVALDDVPASVPTRVFADSGYVLYVNGRELGRGPSRANPRRRRFDVLDLAGDLRPGDNVVTLLAYFNGRATANWMPGPTGASLLARGAVVLEADLGPHGLLATDDSWLSKTVAGWTTSDPTGLFTARGLEQIDLAALPPDLHRLEVDPASGWRPAKVKSARTLGDPDRRHPPSYPFGPLEASPLPTRAPVERPLEPRGDGVWTLPEVAVGTLVIDAVGEDRAEVSISTAERLDAEERPIPFDEEIGVRVRVDTDPVTVETIDQYGLRAVEVTAPPGAEIRSLVLRERVHPVTGGARFSCSDPLLDRIYSVGRRTVSLCSLDAYVDCPTREQRAWTGDAVVHQMVDLVTNDDWSLARWHPRMSASPRPDGMLPMAVSGDIEHNDLSVIPDWALHWIRSVWNLHRYVGDREEIAELAPVAERIVDWFHRFVDPETGLPTDVFGWVIIDWASIPTDGASAPLVGLLGRALLDLADLADFLGDTGRADRARSRHAALRESFEAFWDPRLERYADTLVAGVRGPTASQHAQAAALVAGFAPAERHARLVELLTDRELHVDATYSVPDGPAPPNSEAPIGGAYLIDGHADPWWDTDRLLLRAQPFFRYVVHDALAAAGRADLVVRVLRDWEVLLERCPTSWSECWFGGTTSHGWSSTPTRDLIVHVLGVQPAEPGYDAVTIDPALGDLSWAEAVVPSPAGPIEVRVEGRRVAVTSPVPVRAPGHVLGPGRHALDLP